MTSSEMQRNNGLRTLQCAMRIFIFAKQMQVTNKRMKWMFDVGCNDCYMIIIITNAFNIQQQ